ncbi:MAG: bile acid:sodium symporter family protein [Thermoguttaceae bacterium]
MIDWFVLALGGMILLAYLVPQPSAMQHPVSLHQLCDYGVAIIFFFYGLKLGWKSFFNNSRNWRLHLLVHCTTFILYPSIIFVILHFFGTNPPTELWIGVFFLAALPSTVSSSVVMVSLARGNVPAAVFCAALSSILGIFLTPLWMKLFLTVNTVHFQLGPTFRSLALLVLLPILLGIIANPFCGKRLAPYFKPLRYFDQSVILLIVYASFCDSFRDKAFNQLSLTQFALLCVGLVGFFFLGYNLTLRLCGFLRLNREDSITATFCGSKKSLLHGTTIGKILWGGSPVLGVILLPTMLYHTIQLLLISMIATRLGNEKNQES